MTTRLAFFACSLAAALTLVALTRPAAAAPGPSLPVVGAPTSIAAGVFLPSGGNAKDAGGSAQLDVEFRYGLPVPNPIPTTRTIIGLGIQTGAKSGKHATVIPVTIGELFSASGKSLNAPGAVYIGGGAGAYFQNLSGISSALRLGVFGEAGINITSAAYLDARYQFVTHSNGLSVTAGLRF